MSILYGWNVAGCLVGVGIGYIQSLLSPERDFTAETDEITASFDNSDWFKKYVILGIYFFFNHYHKLHCATHLARINT